MNKLFLILICCAVILQSCERNDYLEPVQGTPAFSIEGLRNGEAFTVTAGEDGLIQTATIERNKYGVMEWRSNFVSASCPTCDPILSVILHDDEGSTLAECSNLELFNQSQLLFATEPTTSAYTTCELSLDEQEATASFEAEEATELSNNQFTFDEQGVHEISASFVINNEPGEDNNEIEIHQTIYAGAHHHMSAPFLYEVLENDEGETQTIRLFFPDNDPQIRATHWVINGITYQDESRTIDIPHNQFFEIEIHYMNDAIAQSGSYSLSFDHGFPIDPSMDEEEHIAVAPSIHIDWETPTPNYEKAIIEYRWNGKLYTSTTSLNGLPAAFIQLLQYQPFGEGLQGSNAISTDVEFSVKLTEVGNEANVLELQNCAGTIGFVVPN